MRATPRYLVQMSSAEIAFLHAVVQGRLRGFVAERPEGRGLEPAAAPPELVSLDRRLLARLEEVTCDEESYFRARRTRPEAGWIAEEHAVLAEAAARSGVPPHPRAGTSDGERSWSSRDRTMAPTAITTAARPDNVVVLHRSGRPAA